MQHFTKNCMSNKTRREVFFQQQNQGIHIDYIRTSLLCKAADQCEAAFSHNRIIQSYVVSIEELQ